MRHMGATLMPLLFCWRNAGWSGKTPVIKHLFLLLTIVAASASCSVFAQEKAALQPNATVVSLLQGSAGKSVELHLRSGEKMGGKIAQVTDNVVHPSKSFRRRIFRRVR